MPNPTPVRPPAVDARIGAIAVSVATALTVVIALSVLPLLPRPLR